MRIAFEILDKQIHNREDFDCGAKDLNIFLKDQANQRQKRNNAVTHVAVDADSKGIPKIIYGYYTLSNHSLEYSILPSDDAKKAPHREKVPCLKLGRLARNRLYSSSGFGEIILIEVFRKAISLSSEVGIYLIDVDLLNDRVSKFYKKYGFKEFIDDNNHMFITIETIKKLFKGQKLIEEYLPSEIEGKMLLID